MASKKENLTIFVILTILSTGIIYSANHIPPGGELGFGADFMPKIVGYLLAFCAVSFLVQGLLTPGKEQKTVTWDCIPIIRFGTALGLLAIYIALLKPVGFIIMTIFYIFTQTQLMVPPEKRNFMISAVLAVVSAAVIYIVFTKGLNLILPAGILSGIL